MIIKPTKMRKSAMTAHLKASDLLLLELKKIFF